jgi:mono/diheme cytochrome c family protein
MSTPSQRPSALSLISGVIAGIAVYVGVNITIGKAMIPTRESVMSVSHGLSEPNREVTYLGGAQAAVGGAAAGGAYQTVCQSCHQADGKGLPGAFPPLAGSSWVNQDPETPVRIVLLGLSGEIEVGGVKFNAVMPPPVGITDEQIAEAVSHARTNFGNTASKVDAAFVKQVRDGLSGRTQPWSAAELAALRPAADAAPAVDAPTPDAAPAVDATPTPAPEPQ